MIEYNNGDVIINAKERKLVTDNSKMAIPLTTPSSVYNMMAKNKLKELVYDMSNIGNASCYSSMEDKMILINSFNEFFDNIPNELLVLNDPNTCVLLENYIKINIKTRFNIIMYDEFNDKLNTMIYKLILSR